MVLVNDGEPVPAGFKYLLDVFLAKEVLEVWSEHRRGAGPSLDEAVEAITYYGDNDAYLPDDADSTHPTAGPQDSPEIAERVRSIEAAMQAYLERRPIE